MDRLSALNAFVRLSELGTFSAVAKDLRVRQSTISKWVAELEETLGVQLVQRNTRSLRITAAGETLLEGAREIVASYEATVDRLSDAQLSGRLRISVPVVFGRLFVVPTVETFLAFHPRVSVELVFSDHYVNLIEENVDVAIRVGAPVDSNLRSHPLGDTRRHLVASPEYLSISGTVSSPRDLYDHECLVHTGIARGNIWRLTRNSEETVLNVHGRFSANNSDALLSMARAGQGIALLAAWLVEESLAAGELVELLPEYALPRAPIRALTATSKLPPTRVTAFIEHLKLEGAKRFSH